MFDIQDNGAILVGNNFVIDGHYKRLFRAVTHFHADHINELNKSIKECTSIIASPITIESLQVLGYNVPKHKQLPLNYGVKVDLLGEKIKLERAEHIMGASQVVIETEKGIEIAYTGDFRNPGKGTPILNPDVLIIDVTYGNPNFVRKYKDDIEMLFADYVADALLKGPVTIYAYYGKLQEVMKVLRKYNVDAPFVVENKVEKLTAIAEKYGEMVGKFVNKNTEEGKKIIKDGWYVEFKHATEFKRRTKTTTNFLLDGWLVKDFIKPVDSNSFIIGFSSHGDFEDNLKYVEMTTADLVILDGSRSKYAYDFAVYVTKYYRKKVKVLPSSSGS
ncbi:MBL fold metallo-hydrolase [Stygiolobus azoricus]|uniref:MBL fold metallo-hydrolase n=1 Tax=Stygiolobus azoricus TaxID=41675 RepID=A0A650CLE0_9CREN|nr:MBL fold metallo-hydrolase [Stygiolobus azoricus]QGR18694.1 MBL fold metallo-hydrolase [Stygiolobus azoricus]